jgi:AcrR family transcriptional regulator
MTKKEKLIKTAKKLFSEKGFYGTPTAMIAKEAGVSNGILFHYYPTKNDLINALYADVKEQIFLYIQSQTYLGATLKESLFTLWLATVEWQIEHPDDFDFMLQYEHSPFFNQEIERSTNYIQLLESLVNKGFEQKLLKQIDPQLVIRLMESTMYTTVKFLRQNPEKESDFALRANLFDMAWDAVKR